jgi:hypothetical protein
MTSHVTSAGQQIYRHFACVRLSVFFFFFFFLTYFFFTFLLQSLTHVSCSCISAVQGILPRQHIQSVGSSSSILPWLPVSLIPNFLNHPFHCSSVSRMGRQGILVSRFLPSAHQGPLVPGSALMDSKLILIVVLSSPLA